MLRIGSRVKMKDNSGARAVRIYHMGIKKTFKGSSLKYNNLAKGAILGENPNRKLKVKTKVLIIITCVAKKVSRKNGCYIKFSANKGLVINDAQRRKPFATKSKLTAVKEIRQDKRNKLVYRVTRKAI